MVNFRELEILKCGSALRLDVVLEHLDLFTNAYISEIIIDTGKTYIPSGPSSTPIYTKSYPQATTTVVEELSSDILQVNLNKEILFVYVKVEGLPNDYDETKYGLKTDVKSVVNLYIYYDRIINSIKSLDKNCVSNNEFINNMLLFKAYEYASLMCNYNLAISLWYKFIVKNKINLSKNCGCNG